MFKTAGSILIVLLIYALSLDAKSLLYKVSSPSSTVYILGSIHLAKPELYPLERAIEEAYNKCDVLVVELDAESRESMTVMQNAMMTLGTYPKQCGAGRRQGLSFEAVALYPGYHERNGTDAQPPCSCAEKRGYTVVQK